MLDNKVVTYSEILIFKGCDSNFEAKYSQISKNSTNEITTLLSTICTRIEIEIFNNNDQQFTRHFESSVSTFKLGNIYLKLKSQPLREDDVATAPMYQVYYV